MENQLFFYGLFSAILGFLYFIYRIGKTKIPSFNFLGNGNRSLIKKFIENADRIPIDLNKVEFRHQVNEKESFDFKPYERDILLESNKSKKYSEYKNRGIIKFTYKNQEYKHLIYADGIPEKSLLTYFYLQKETYLYIDKENISKRYLDLSFLTEATNGKFQNRGIEFIDLDTYDLKIKHSIYG
ncbi:hypothetical protein [Aquimarina algicola]|uniref:Uncharacterized protein n=1 Tax=Aquimarina algicola TaxID=2589995 RepID=A0A504JEL3_9FLAO|nr:hypothetical protein [Aquimarina algicola]TPN87112.1 hypothetical protein FHK87_05840 [Aquimarina algicola]